MSIFSLGKTKRYLGVDFGTSSLKVVELEDKEGKAKLLTYGIAQKQIDISRADSPSALREISDLLKEIVKRAHVSTDKVIAGLPGSAIFSSTINLPEMKEHELAQAVKWEAKKFIPLELSEVILDWKLLKEKEKIKNEEAESAESAGEEEVKKRISRRVLLTAAPRDLVQKYIDIVNNAGLAFESLETEAFALTRSLVGFDPTTVLIIDIGARVTHLAIIEDEIPIMHRSLDIGGDQMTQAIAKALNVNEVRAEQFKRDVGLSGAERGGGIPEAISNVLDRVIQEASYLLKLYSHQHEGGCVEKIILTGGSSYLVGLSALVTERVGIQAFVGDPWARIVYPEYLAPALNAAGARLGVAIGLAMRKIV